jgi:hypothetical protein
MTLVIMGDPIVLHYIQISLVDFETGFHYALFMTMTSYGICSLCIAYSCP